MPKGIRPITKKKKPTQAATEADRETVINMKGSAGYASWLEGVHQNTHIPKVQIVRLALAEWAETHGHPSPPEI